MSQSPHVIDATEADFERVVLEESRKRPVVVDFWAPWCGPCRALGPILEKVAEEEAGRFLLVKLNTDEAPRLSAEMGIRGIPAVKAFVDGRVVAEFVGAVPESEVRRFIRSFVKSDDDEQAERALALLRQGNIEEAERLASEVLARNERHALSWLVKTEAALARGDVDEAERRFPKIAADPRIDPLTDRLEAKLKIAKRIASTGDEPALLQRLEKGDDPEAALGVAAYEALADKYEAAFERALLVMTRHRGTHKEPAHELILALIQLAPEEAAREMRKRLSLALY